jgi:hypothetical protein
VLIQFYRSARNNTKIVKVLLEKLKQQLLQAERHHEERRGDVATTTTMMMMMMMQTRMILNLQLHKKLRNEVARTETWIV